MWLFLRGAARSCPQPAARASPRRGRAGRLRHADEDLVSRVPAARSPAPRTKSRKSWRSGLDQHGGGPVGRAGWYWTLLPGPPFEGEVGDALRRSSSWSSQRFPGTMSDGKPPCCVITSRTVMSPLPVPGEFRHVLGDAVAEAQRSLFHQRPDRGDGDDLGVGVQRNRLRASAGRPSASRAAPKLRENASLPCRATATCAPDGGPRRLASMRGASRSSCRGIEAERLGVRFGQRGIHGVVLPARGARGRAAANPMPLAPGKPISLLARRQRRPATAPPATPPASAPSRR